MKKSFVLGRLGKPPAAALLTAVAVVALAVAGAAIADGGAATTSSVSATFAATTVVTTSTRTCTGSDGQYVTTHATYTGISSGSANTNLNGPIQIDLTSVFNATTNLGWVEGNVRFNPATMGGTAHGNLTAVNAGGQLQGFLSGDAGPGTQLRANVSATFSTTAGFTNGSLGTASANNTATVSTGSCAPVQPPTPPLPPIHPPAPPVHPPNHPPVHQHHHHHHHHHDH